MNLSPLNCLTCPFRCERGERTPKGIYLEHFCGHPAMIESLGYAQFISATSLEATSLQWGACPRAELTVQQLTDEVSAHVEHYASKTLRKLSDLTVKRLREGDYRRHYEQG